MEYTNGEWKVYQESMACMHEALLSIVNSETITDRENFNNALEALAKAEENNELPCKN